MVDAGGDAIVNMASTAGIEAVGGLAGYVSAKYGVIGLTKTAAREYANPGDSRQRGRARTHSHRESRAGGARDAAPGRHGDAHANGRTTGGGRTRGPVALLGPGEKPAGPGQRGAQCLTTKTGSTVKSSLRATTATITMI
jgi:short chain dehydrogenase